MSLKSSNQRYLFGFNKIFKDLVHLYDHLKLPNKILFSGQKCIGKSTLAYHFINYVLSKDEEHKYDIQHLEINNKNKSFILVQNSSHPNFTLIDLLPDKKSRH